MSSEHYLSNKEVVIHKTPALQIRSIEGMLSHLRCISISASVLAIFAFTAFTAFADENCSPRWPDFVKYGSFYRVISGDPTTLVVCSDVDGMRVEDIARFREQMSCGKAAPVIDGTEITAATVTPLAYVFVGTKNSASNLVACMEKSEKFFGIDSAQVFQQITDPRRNRPIIPKANIPGVAGYVEAATTSYNYQGQTPFMVTSISDFSLVEDLIKDNIFGLFRE
jgi:hypothetical protein